MNLAIAHYLLPITYYPSGCPNLLADFAFVRQTGDVALELALLAFSAYFQIELDPVAVSRFRLGYIGREFGLQKHYSPLNPAVAVGLAARLERVGTSDLYIDCEWPASAAFDPG
jgi:hypothetical protein